MLTLILKGPEVYNEQTNKVGTVDDVIIELEHSLFSLSKWESFYEEPFLTEETHSPDKMLYYIECMMLTDTDPKLLNRLTKEQVLEINEYINAKKTATWFTEEKQTAGRRKSSESTTSELIYYWMVAYTIPWEAQYWHLNRLITLVKICNIKNQPEKKMNKRDLMSRNRALNEARKAQMNSNG